MSDTATPSSPDATAGWLARSAFARLLTALQAQGYRCVGPQVRDGAIVYDTLSAIAELPAGVQVEQTPGRYRLHTDAADRRCFAWANGPQGLKPWVFVPQETLWNVRRDAAGKLQFSPAAVRREAIAVLGVRACDLAALDLQDKHFLAGRADPAYAGRRQGLLLIAVNCSRPAATCFCAATQDGPAARAGYDVLLDELDDGYVVRSASAAGRAIVDQLPLQAVSPDRWRAVTKQNRAAAAAQTRGLPAADLAQRLFERLDHPQWEAVAARCLACGNCTSVCPTCFCHAELEQPALDGSESRHLRQWDSCFTQAHSYVHGHTVRASTAQRYRQWLTHKFGSWHLQYGRSGCVGCGRCIAWCPVGIDVTAELAALMADPVT